METRQHRLAGLVASVTGVVWLVWMWSNLNWGQLWVALPYAAANVLVFGSIGLTSVNNWQRSVPPAHYLRTGQEPHVAVLIPTCGEPLVMIERTIFSVLEQDWPAGRLLVVVGDDARSGELREYVERIARNNPFRVVYHEPSPRGSPTRRGDAKAGNLNSMVDALEILDPAGLITYIETRDADDEVGDHMFLRRVVAQLEADPEAAYVQTIKRARVSPGDPFGNREAMFYESVMLSKHAANAVIPCGSGLVWRRAALADINGFPAWNLVEDLQSGVEALRRGWRGVYLPIVGAVAQHSPEDLKNVYKQRGTWALDTVRLLFWGNLSGLTVRQRLQFLEVGLFYLQGLALLVFAVYPIVGLLTNSYPLVTTQLEFALFFWPAALSVELFLASLQRGRSFEEYWRSRQMWAGLSVVYAVSAVRAICFGPHRKPTYRVTRKTNSHYLQLREVVPHLLLCAGLLVSTAIAIRRDSFLTELDLGSLYWGFISFVLLGSFCFKAAYGVPLRQALEPARLGVLVGQMARRLGPAGMTIDLRKGSPLDQDNSAAVSRAPGAGAQAGIDELAAGFTEVSGIIDRDKVEPGVVEGRSEPVQHAPARSLAASQAAEAS